MNIFIVTIEYCNDSTILEAFSTFELARAEMNRYISNIRAKDFLEIKRITDDFWTRAR